MSAVGGEDGGGGGLASFSRGEGGIGEGSGGEAVGRGYGLGDVDKEGGCLEKGDHEEKVVVWVEFGGVDGGFEFSGADPRLV